MGHTFLKGVNDFLEICEKNMIFVVCEIRVATTPFETNSVDLFQVYQIFTVFWKTSKQHIVGKFAFCLLFVNALLIINMK